MLTLISQVSVLAAVAQGHDQLLQPDPLTIFPDKVTEMLVPLLFLFLLLNMLVTVLKNRAEMRLKEKMVDKGVSEEALITLFDKAHTVQHIQSLRWFLFAGANGLALVLLHFGRPWLAGQSGYLGAGMVLLFNAGAFFIHYRLMSKKT